MDSVNLGLTACEFGCHGVASSASGALRYQCPSPSPSSTDPPAWQFQSSCDRPASAHAHIIANEHLRWRYVRNHHHSFASFAMAHHHPQRTPNWLESPTGMRGTASSRSSAKEESGITSWSSRCMPLIGLADEHLPPLVLAVEMGHVRAELHVRPCTAVFAMLTYACLPVASPWFLLAALPEVVREAELVVGHQVYRLDRQHIAMLRELVHWSRSAVSGFGSIVEDMSAFPDARDTGFQAWGFRV